MFAQMMPQRCGFKGRERGMTQSAPIQPAEYRQAGYARQPSPGVERPCPPATAIRTMPTDLPPTRPALPGAPC